MREPSTLQRSLLGLGIAALALVLAHLASGCGTQCVAWGLPSEAACEQWCKRSACGQQSRPREWDAERLGQSLCACEASR